MRALAKDTCPLGYNPKVWQLLKYKYYIFWHLAWAKHPRYKLGLLDSRYFRRNIDRTIFISFPSEASTSSVARVNQVSSEQNLLLYYAYSFELYRRIL